MSYLSEKKRKKIVLETYQMLFEASEPKLDFMNFILHATKYVDNATGKIVEESQHLTEEEQHARNYAIYIPYEKHFITDLDLKKIVNDQIKKYKLDTYQGECLKTQVYLGCAPTTKKEV